MKLHLWPIAAVVLSPSSFRDVAAQGDSEELPITSSDVFVQSGEVTDTSINIMARCNNEADSAASLHLEGMVMWDMTLQAFSAKDYTVTFEVQNLTSSTYYEYSVKCWPFDPTLPTVSSMTASFTTLPDPEEAAAISFVWAADLAGQGWGRNPDFTVTTPEGKTIKGGYVVFETMESLNPMFGIFQGDMVYADNAIPPEKEIPAEVGGGVWINNPSKDFVAVTLDEFRANWKYNFGDDKMQSFLANTPVFVQWDDHEVTNNWYPGEVIGADPLYKNGTAADSLYTNAVQSFYEFNPLVEGSPIYRSQKFGKHLEIFFPDYRSYRDPNTGSNDPNGTAMMGREQLDWLKLGLASSGATWKVISSHDPINIVTGGEGDRDSFGQLDPAILGRELEVQELLSYIYENEIRGVISLSSDVHFTAHVNIDPARAEGGFVDFLPLDEFVIGPINSGAFGPNDLDTSFGPEYVYAMGPSTIDLPMNMPPTKSDIQSFGHASITAEGELVIKLIDITGKVMYTKTMTPQATTPITTADVFVQSGELSDTSINIMARCNSEVGSTASLYIDGTMIMEQQAKKDHDYTVTFEVEELSSDTSYGYHVTCTSLVNTKSTLSSVDATFTTLPGPDEEAPVSFVWVADLAGQGWGRNPNLSVETPDGKVIKGGYVVFEVMESLKPQFALFQGDMIYADNTIPPTMPIPEEVGGGVWVNNPTKDFIAMTLDEFRENWKYNFGDEKMQSFLSKTPVYVQWDDHEVTNNWWPGELLFDDEDYKNGTAVNGLYKNSLQAFYEFNPLVKGSSIYRSQKFGKHLEIFFVDYRSFRDPNSGASDPSVIAMMGREQLDWLKNGLLNSTATWKILSSHDPISIVTGGEGDRDSFGQLDPAILGREFELKELFSFIHDNEIHGVVSLTSDVHFTAHVNSSPSRAKGGFVDYFPLDEFVIGPINSGAFGPNDLDTSFGPEYVFAMGPSTVDLPANIPPTRSDLQSFGHASVTAEGDLEIKLIDISGKVMYNKTMFAPHPTTTSKVFVQSGELSDTSINIMTRCNIEKDSLASLYIDGEMIMEEPVYRSNDYTVTFEVTSLSSSTKHMYHVDCTPFDPVFPTVSSMDASFTTLQGPEDAETVSFVWVADLAGQGWGRNPSLSVETPDGKVIKGGYVVFEVMESLKPQFALFQGDMIYADGKIPPTVPIPAEVGGGVWINNPSKDFIAVDLDGFRENWKYNFGDEKMQSFLAKTPVYVQWDDHEVTNNWFPGEILLGDANYKNGTAASSLYEDSIQAFYEFNPIVEFSSIYRSQKVGKNLELFFPDYRSYRDPNPGNSDPAGIAMMGREQLDWLKRGLKESTSTWKIISSHDPLTIVTGGAGDHDSFSQEDPAILGRELEVRELLAYIKENDIKGVVVLTSDVHFTAHVNMDPSRAEGGFTDFIPLDEFVIGPINAGAFGPGALDTSFGPEYVYVMATGTMDLPGNMPPAQSDLQSFGHVSIGASGDLEVKLISISGKVMYNTTLAAQA